MRQRELDYRERRDRFLKESMEREKIEQEFSNQIMLQYRIKIDRSEEK